MTSLFDFEATAIDGSARPLDAYRGNVVLVVNTASKCGFTPQFTGLQNLYDTHHDQGFEILGFPCDQFMHQEPKNEDEIAEFCSVNYGVTFPMFAKIDVNGSKAHPLFKFLRGAKGGLLGDRIKWNFTKFLVDRDGNPIERFAPATTPEKLTADVERLL